MISCEELTITVEPDNETFTTGGTGASEMSLSAERSSGSWLPWMR